MAYSYRILQVGSCKDVDNILNKIPCQGIDLERTHSVSRMKEIVSNIVAKRAKLETTRSWKPAELVCYSIGKLFLHFVLLPFVKLIMISIMQQIVEVHGVDAQANGDDAEANGDDVEANGDEAHTNGIDVETVDSKVGVKDIDVEEFQRRLFEDVRNRVVLLLFLFLKILRRNLTNKLVKFIQWD